MNLITNCYNNNISINVFLNEKCKNAMNLTDFVNQIKVQLEDVMYTQNSPIGVDTMDDFMEIKKIMEYKKD